jgi:hypothetical protein
LQTARAETTSETNGRSSVFLASVSSAIVALAFIGQISAIGYAFYVFALLLFPALFFLGLVTFARVVQASTWDFVYFRGIARIHHLYIELAPQLERYFVVPSRDDEYSVGLLPGPSFLQFFLTAAGLISVINSVILGVLTSLVVSLIIVDPLLWSIISGVLACAASIVLHMKAMYRAFAWADEQVPRLFPTSRVQQGQTQAQGDQ